MWRFGSEVMGAVKGGVKGQPEWGDSWQGHESRVQDTSKGGVKGKRGSGVGRSQG